MTLCIAAECEYKGRPIVAVCADWRAQTGDIGNPEVMIGSDDARKTREYYGATVLLAGIQAKAVELSIACKSVIEKFARADIPHHDIDIGVDQFLQDLRAIARSKKADLIKSHVMSVTGLDHAEFVRLPTDQYLDVWHGIRALNLGADIIIACVKHEPIIVRLDRWGEATWETNYAAIGSGSDIARAMLKIHEWVPAAQHTQASYVRGSVPLRECVFRIKEAHFVAHKANPSAVGDKLTVQFLGAKYRAGFSPIFMHGIHMMIEKKHVVPDLSKGPTAISPIGPVKAFDSDTAVGVEPEEL